MAEPGAKGRPLALVLLVQMDLDQAIRMLRDDLVVEIARPVRRKELREMPPT